MELLQREYADWAEEDEKNPAGNDPVAEMIRMREDESRAPVRSWLVPIVDDIGKCIRNRFMSRILQEMNDRLISGELSLLVGQALKAERLLSRDLAVDSIICWRINRTDFLADIDLTVSLPLPEDEPEHGPFRLCLSLWFCTEGDFHCEVQDLSLRENRPERSFWKLDRFLVPILRPDEIETGADRMWENYLPDIRDPKERSARMLAKKLGLSIWEARLYCQNQTKSILFFREGSVLIQEEKQPGEEDFPLPVSRKVPAGTIVINNAARSESRDLDIFHECIHYEWHLLFYRLQQLMSTNPLEIRYKTVRNTFCRSAGDPVHLMEWQAQNGSIALMVPKSLVLGKAWKLFLKNASFPSVNGYLNHPGFRWDRVIRCLADEYHVPRTTFRRRLVQLGYASAAGAVNFVDGDYITPFAFSGEHTPRGQTTYIISRKALTELYHRSREFRQFMGHGDFVWADGHVCLNDPEFLRPTRNGARLTPWANAHVDECCLRFEKVWLQESGESFWLFGTLNSSGDYLREYDSFLDRRQCLSARERMERRNRLMQSMPASFPDALIYLMDSLDGEKITLEELAARAHVSTRTVIRYRSPSYTGYNPDVIVAICIAMHLPPWLSRMMLDKAGFSVKSYGPQGYYGEILDCCFMDTIPDIQNHLRSVGYPELKLQES